MRHLVSLLLALSLLPLTACGNRLTTTSRSPVTPAASHVFTSTRSVTSLLALPDGTLWAGTTGGLLRCSPNGAWRKWTRAEGLPSEETLRLALDGDDVAVAFPGSTVVWRDERWQPRQRSAPEAATSAARTCPYVIWRGAKCMASLTGLEIGEGAAKRIIPLPPSLGSHISALLPRGNALWAALYGDGLWELKGERWQPVCSGLPPAAREITALAANGMHVWIGTRRAGVWQYENQRWSAASPTLDEPADHNIQFLTFYQKALYASTLENGLMIRTSQGWQQVTSPTLSANAPRQMTVFRDQLYVRQGDGRVDRYDGARWARNVFAFLPRGRVSALASDSTRLYLAEWGGWSEYNGRAWIHHLTLPALQGLVLTCLCPDSDTLWIGTQGRGVAQVSRKLGTVRWHDERRGLPDDWITCLTHAGTRVYAGTFVGGLTCWDGARWTTPPALRDQNVTALAPDGRNGLWITTRQGGWHQDSAGTLRPLAPKSTFLETEQQAVLPVSGGIWIGARTGLDFLSLPTEQVTAAFTGER